MASYKQVINRAIMAAGLDKVNFEVTSDQFESKLEDVNRGNRQVSRVAKELVKAGYNCTSRKTGWGGWFVTVNEYRHFGHEVDYCSTASVYHY